MIADIAVAVGAASADVADAVADGAAADVVAAAAAAVAAAVDVAAVAVAVAVAVAIAAAAAAVRPEGPIIIGKFFSYEGKHKHPRTDEIKASVHFNNQPADHKFKQISCTPDKSEWMSEYSRMKEYECSTCMKSPSQHNGPSFRWGLKWEDDHPNPDGKLLWTLLIDRNAEKSTLYHEPADGAADERPIFKESVMDRLPRHLR